MSTHIIPSATWYEEYLINGELAKALCKGCTIELVKFDRKGCPWVLVRCPKDYYIPEEGTSQIVKFLCFEKLHDETPSSPFYLAAWYDCIYPQAKNYFLNSLQEMRIMQLRAQENKAKTKAKAND